MFGKWLRILAVAVLGFGLAGVATAEKLTLGGSAGDCEGGLCLWVSARG